ncbi:unnamed protein product [Ceutorhynchus assimilis]|uniref:Uncharacterized protein n=1 Tax=Ceutorhynchus assimilis TaxID=467358 RepID=A0A9N9QRZ8_9CUCU|nr:unnamed protein product [Ceutorhynchus assimilis]
MIGRNVYIQNPTTKRLDNTENAVIESESSVCDEPFAVSEDSCDDPGTEKDTECSKVCIFCNSNRKKHTGRWQNLHSSCAQDTGENIKSQATEMNDMGLLTKIENLSSQGCPILYHRICLVQFQNKFQSHIASEKEKTDWHMKRDTVSAAFDKICSFVYENIIRNKHSYYLDFLRTLYAEYLSEEVRDSKTSPNTFYTRYLEERLLKTYPKGISVIQNNRRKIVKPYTGVVLKDSDFSLMQDEEIVQKAAVILRRSIRELEKRSIPEKISVPDLINGECIANKALKIQSEKRPLFDNLFIHIGPFHIMMVYFKAIGKYIDNCGLTNIIVDTELLASGSVNGLITGKHFNRCKRLHPLAALAIQIMHYESFVKLTNLEIPEETRQYLEDLKNERHDNPEINNQHLLEILKKYEEYETSTLAGEYGKTPQFYLIYSNLVHYYLLLNRSIRIADLDLFKFVLPKITNLFFTFNQQNYSRYLVKYSDNLQKVDETHPGLKEQFEKGSIGIRRTSKPFSRQPIDLVLQQTINADTANKLTGIIQSTNSISARQRWCKSHSIRARIITHVMETTGLRNRQDITADLRKSSIDKSADQLKKLIANIRQNMNPFSSTLDGNYLYNISSGKAAKADVAEFLLNVEKIGNEQREKFITECAEDGKRFESVIKRNKVYSFTKSQKKKINVSGKVVEVHLSRALPAFHAFTGCDFNPAYFKKGKKRPFTVLQNSPQLINVFSNMHKYPDIDKNYIFDTLEKFICELYGFKTMNSVNEVRLATFMKAYKFSDTQEQLKLQSTSFDGSILPPCKMELQQQIQRAIYISSVWCNAHFQHPTLLSPTDCGWQEVDNKLEFLWFEGDQLPTSISDIIIDKISETDDAENKTLVSDRVQTTENASKANLVPLDNDQQENDDVSSEFENDDDPDKDPNYVDLCSVLKCKKEAFHFCKECELNTCKFHLKQSECCQHNTTVAKNKFPNINFSTPISEEANKVCSNSADEGKKSRQSPTRAVLPSTLNSTPSEIALDNSDNSASADFRAPEEYIVEGSRREIEKQKVTKKATYKTVQKLRQSGKPYIRPRTMNLVPPKRLKEYCKGETCKRNKKRCHDFKEEDRQQLLNAYYELESIQLQREYICRYVDKFETKQKTTKDNKSRRNFSFHYFLPLQKVPVPVCKPFFLNTLSISEKVMRNAMEKLQSSGIVEKDKRGGRQESMKIKDNIVRQAMQNHINRFPRVESHYCRKSSSREYLHPDLTIPLMHNIPKKDVCSLCITYNEGDTEKKVELEERYKAHIERKEKIRKIKQQCKDQSIADKSILSAVFDLQQVIYLPKSNESAIFYKRRLAVYNFTVYNLATKDCHCYTWSEIDSKRGSSEISTCVYNFLQHYDEKGTVTVNLFSDGCAGQNKNSIVASMLLYFVTNSKNVEQVSLKFFEPFHGQSEGDSCHSTISTAMSHSGNLFVPSQLLPIFKLARRKQPYIVNKMEHTDFLDFKDLSKNLRILSIREDDNKNKVNWTDISEFKVEKKEPNKMFYKLSHCDGAYRSITLKRKQENIFNLPVEKLNKQRPKVTAIKYDNLVSLCSGKDPVVKSFDHIAFYRSLPHE